MSLLPWDRTGAVSLCPCSPGPQSVPAGWPQPREELPAIWVLHEQQDTRPGIPGQFGVRQRGSFTPKGTSPLPDPAGSWGLPGLCHSSTDQNQTFHTPALIQPSLTQYSCQTPTSIKDLWAQIHIIKETLRSPKAKRKTY